MSTQENGSLGLTKKSILERLDTLIELNSKIYEATLTDKIAVVTEDVTLKSGLTDAQVEFVKTRLTAVENLVDATQVKFAEVEAKRMSTENSLKEFATNVAKVEAEKVKVIIPDTIAITGIATVEAVKEGKKVKTEISAELVTTVEDEVTKQLADQPIII